MSVNGTKRGSSQPLNVLSVDVEDYHNQLAVEHQNRIEPPTDEAERCTDRLLDIFGDTGSKGTFFILGEIAEVFPRLVRRIADEGHHLGVHGYHHERVTSQTPEEFRRSIRKAKDLIEQLTGQEADAYRAPYFSVNESTLWALDILGDLGFRYDSSIFPIQAGRYGIPTARVTPYRHRLLNGKSIWEVPMTTIEIAKRRIGACGGGHLRLYPLRFTQYAMDWLRREGRPANVYLHPYEIEPQPRPYSLPGLSVMQSLSLRFYNRHQRVGRKSVERKVRWLLENHPFGTVEQLVATLEPKPATQVELVEASA
jgi:polysaccharide deacetylase family protein (PEP-CTERM system associated)